MERDDRREATKSTTRRAGLLRKSVAQLAVLGLVAGGALFTFAGTSSAHNHDPQECNDEVQSQTFVGHVHVCKSGPDTAVAGTDITYTIASSRWGLAFGNVFTIDDPLPPGTTLVDASGDGWDCSGSTATEVLCTHETHLLWGSPPDLSVTVHIASGVTDEAIENCANLTLTFNHDWLKLDQGDTDASADTFTPPSDESCVETSITQVSDLSVVKTGPATATAGHDVTYDIAVTNNGPSDSGPITVSDPLPYGSASPLKSFSPSPDWACVSDTATVTCTHGGLVSGASATVELVLHLDVTLVNQPLTNCASVTGGDTSGITTNDKSCTSLTEFGGLIQVEAATVTKATPAFTG
jgi:uncharacterized repeat protein (TIGR01451 family)